MRFGLFKKFAQRVDALVSGRGRIDDELFEELEELLLQADVNVRTTQAVLADLRKAVQEDRLSNTDQVMERLKSSLRSVLERGKGTAGGELAMASQPPTVYLIVGVNGVGKTTTIAKLAHWLQSQGQKVVLAAGDTFRAAAIDQLEVWARRTGTELVKHREGGDPSAVIYDAIRAARARGAQFVIADTAGRLHNRANLMDELRKINRITERELGRPADETLLVLDATTGQNAINQAKEFLSVVPITGIALTKLDGTARGGIVITLADELKIPIKLVGVGEKPEDLQTFDAGVFVESLFS